MTALLISPCLELFNLLASVWLDFICKLRLYTINLFLMSFLLLSLFQDSVPSSCKAATIDKDPDARQAVQSFYCNIFNPHSKPDAVPGDNFLCDVYVLLCWSTGNKIFSFLKRWLFTVTTKAFFMHFFCRPLEDLWILEIPNWMQQTFLRMSILFFLWNHFHASLNVNLR